MGKKVRPAEKDSHVDHLHEATRMVGAQDLEERMFTMESVDLAMSICNLDVEHS